MATTRTEMMREKNSQNQSKYSESSKMQQTIASNKRKQFSSAILFVAAIIILNLCPFHSPDLQEPIISSEKASMGENKYLSTMIHNYNHKRNPYGNNYESGAHLNTYLEQCVHFIKLMFTNPLRLSKRSTGFIQADAKMLGKMAKMWYIKKKIKKLSKKLKKHTIAVPVFTAIPIYEHSYYPQPHVTHVTHGGGLHHAAAASSYSSAVTPATAAAMVAAQQSQQLAASASNSHQQVAPGPYASARQATSAGSPGHFHHHGPPPPMPYHHPMHQAASAQHIINSYAPSPPLYVDEAGGLYGHYGNAYGRYDGGFQMW